MTAPIRGRWTRAQIEKIWDVFSRHDMAFDRESMYCDEGADSEFCEMHRRLLADTLDKAQLVPVPDEAAIERGALALRRVPRRAVNDKADDEQLREWATLVLRAALEPETP